MCLVVTYTNVMWFTIAMMCSCPLYNYMQTRTCNDGAFYIFALMCNRHFDGVTDIHHLCIGHGCLLVESVVTHNTWSVY